MLEAVVVLQAVNVLMNSFRISGSRFFLMEGIFFRRRFFFYLRIFENVFYVESINRKILLGTVFRR